MKIHLQLGLIVIIGTAFYGCQDKAAPGYAQCVQLDIKGDVGGAWDACSTAVNASPTSKAGKSAADKLKESGKFRLSNITVARPAP